jgi:NAD(P)-dependent dehydrogenase (short-subunit alcohol dehydrogenase family)
LALVAIFERVSTDSDRSKIVGQRGVTDGPGRACHPARRQYNRRDYGICEAPPRHATPADNTVVEAPIEESSRAIRLDLFGTFLGCRFGIPAIIASGGGSAINMASNVALMGVASVDCYTAAKGGIAAITRSMAVEFAPQKVRVNAIAPAATMTDRVRGRFASGNPRVTKITAAHLIGLIEPDDIANMAVFLASDESRMVTGHVYPVDSGITIS